MTRQNQASSSTIIYRTLSLLLVFGVILGVSHHTSQPSSAAVTLIAFSGSYADDPEIAMSIEWETGSEIGTAGFQLRRSASGQAEQEIEIIYDNDPITFIGSEGADLGFIYRVLDVNVTPGTFYKYTLYELEINNSDPIKIGEFEIRATVGSEAVEVGATNTPQPTLTPTSTPTATQGAGSTPSAQATNTPTATATQAGQFQATSTPAATTTQSGEITPTNTATILPTSTADAGGQSSSSGSAQPPTATVESSGTANTEEEDLDSEFEDEALDADGSDSGGSAGINEEADPDIAAPPDTSGSEDGLADDPAASTSNGGAVVEAAEPEQYPDPTDDNSDGTQTETTESYVPPAEPDPITEEDNDGLAVKPIAGDVELPTDETASTGTIANAETNNNRLILWGSFIASLIMFVTGVVGAIFMFRQKQG